MEPKSQLLVIWRSLCEYLKEKLTNYKGINLRGLGSFTFEVSTLLPKLGIDFTQAKTKSFNELLLEKKTQHRLRPCFVVDPKFLHVLTRFKNKEEITKPKSQSSIYQKGFQMTYCNPVPIAASCFINSKVVTDALNAFTNAIYDLVAIGRNVYIKTGFCNINFIDRNLVYSFSPEINAMTKDLHSSEEKFRRGVTPVQKTWRETAIDKWAKSTLSSLLERPQTPLIKTIDNKSQMLKIMSLDMASTYGHGFYKK